MPGARIALPETEARHARVLRLESGTRVELGDAQGRIAQAQLEIGGDEIHAVIEAVQSPQSGGRALKVTIATAWPKGKRAAMLVEKCAELGVESIIPIEFARSAVHKDEESEGVQRLRRIAAEASKQSGRAGVMEIGTEHNFPEFLEAEAASGARMALLDPRGEASLSEWLKESSADACLIVGPEGGFSEKEIELVEQLKVVRVRLAQNILRIETAAIAAAAICGAQ